MYIRKVSGARVASDLVPKSEPQSNCVSHHGCACVYLFVLCVRPP